MEFDRLSSSIDIIYDRLMEAIDETMDPDIVNDADKLKYKDMVE